ncbi:caspase family protein [Cellulomonas sp. URHD0024]|uniref:caspase, EACC1-associated type n=1 Tax=Cellulomonas sp. URHD0024 TaxID=1302620 RepID=UPI0006878DF5|nr:caspase family protein [Cellulomonas sp. URHD0024]
MTAHRRALIVAVDEYADAGLRRLLAPASDAAALAEALAAPGVGDFAVDVVHNGTAQEIRLSVEDFFADAHPDDLLLVHFSGHGLKNAGGELFLAAADSRPDRLASTAVAADFVNRQMAESRAQRIALFLDCCYGGAFPRGMVVRGAGDVQVREAFAETERSSGGRGRVVVTASSAVEYAFEGAELAPGALPDPSVFTGALVRGLTTGDADRDGDGWVGLHELFGYVTEQVRRSTPHQTPHLWAFGSEGELLIAHSGRRTISARTPAPELLEAAASPLSATRLGVAIELRELLVGQDVAVALGAWQALNSMLGDDSRRVDDVVQTALAECRLTFEPPELVVGSDSAAVHQVRLVGPPLARSASVAVDEPWLHADVDDAGLRVTVTPDADVAHAGTVRVTTPVGVHTLAVSTVAKKTRGRPATRASSTPDDRPAPAPTGDHPAPGPQRSATRDRPAVVPVSGSSAPTDGSTPSRTPVWAAGGMVLLLVGITVGSLRFVTWTSSITDGGAGSSRAFAIPAALLSVLVVASVVWPNLGSVALGCAAGGFVAYLGFGLFTLMSGLGYETDDATWRAIVIESLVGVLVALAALVLRRDLTPAPRLSARTPPVAVVLLVLGLGSSAGFPFTGEHDSTVADATAWYLVLPAAFALVVGAAVLLRGSARLGHVLDAAAYAVLAVSTFQVVAWLLRNGALDNLALLAVLGAALLAGAVLVNARARSAGTRQAGP